MAFWKDNTTDPKRQFRFKIDGNEIWWWAKSIDKPTVEVSSNSYQLINHYLLSTWTRWRGIGSLDFTQQYNNKH